MECWHIASYIYLYLSLIFCITTVNAQTDEQPDAQIGVKFGLGMAKFNIGSKSNDIYKKSVFQDNRLGPFLGIYANYKINEFIYLDFELNYLQKGTQDEYEVVTVEEPDGTGEKVSYDYQLDYIQFIPSLQAVFPLPFLDIYAKAGPAVNYMLSTKGIFYFKDAKEFIIGYNLGLGIKIKNICERQIILEVCRDADFMNFY